ncbi:MAG: ABC transporter permease [Flavobacteriales bacterium]|jgi:lipopolysaccharide transport system permease protein|nr:ABC transporter permease [Flavobacteriales bacterium]
MRTTIIIAPGARTKHYWSDLWRYRGLLGFLAWRDVMVRYKQTAIGVLWAVVRPLITLAAMWFIGWLFGSTVPEGVPRVLLVAAATMPWQLFASAFDGAANSMIGNSNLVTKVYFPRMVLPLSTVLVSLIDMAVALVILFVLMLLHAHLPGPEVLLLPVFLALAVLAALGTGLYMAALNVKYRDFRYIVPVIVQFGLYITPVAFSSSDVFANPRVPEAVKFIFACNPMVAVIDGFRFCLFGGDMPIHWPGFLTSLGVSLLLLVLGVRYFRRTEKGFADII